MEIRDKDKNSISLKSNPKNIMEFIHIRDGNGKYLCLVSIFNSCDGTTEVTLDKEV